LVKKKAKTIIKDIRLISKMIFLVQKKALNNNAFTKIN
jgi:hypothetical protein